MDIMSILTDATCGEVCWNAREDICRCSCHGKNHGCLKSPEGINPIRTAKIHGYVYELKAIGKYSEIHRQAEDICKIKPYKTETYMAYNPDTQKSDIVQEYDYYYRSTDVGSPAICKSATKSQISNWKELEMYKNMDRVDLYHLHPYLLWIKKKEVKQC